MSRITKAELIVQLTDEPSVARMLMKGTIKDLQTLIAEKIDDEKIDVIKGITSSEQFQTELFALSIDCLNMLGNAGNIVQADKGNRANKTNKIGTIIPNIRVNALQVERELSAQLNKLNIGAITHTTATKTLSRMLHFNAWRKKDYDCRTRITTYERGSKSTTGNDYTPGKMTVIKTLDFKKASIRLHSFG